MRSYSSVKAEQVELSHTCFRIFGTWHNFGKLGRNATNHNNHRQNNPKTLTLCVRSNEAVIQGQGYLGGGVLSVLGYLGRYGSLEKLGSLSWDT